MQVVLAVRIVVGCCVVLFRGANAAETGSVRFASVRFEVSCVIS